MLVLYEVTLDPQFALPMSSEKPDAEQEARYLDCYEKRDTEIHRAAFGSIDNPDVQKEFINTNRAQAAAACRTEYPVRSETVSTPFRFNLIDLSPRFW